MENFLLSAKSCDIIYLCYIKKIKNSRQQLKNISLLFNNSWKNFVQFSKIFCNLLLCNLTHAKQIYFEYQLKALRFYEGNNRMFYCVSSTLWKIFFCRQNPVTSFLCATSRR